MPAEPTDKIVVKNGVVVMFPGEAGETDISSFCKKVSIEPKLGEEDVSALGDAVMQTAKGVMDATVSLDLLYAKDPTQLQDALMAAFQSDDPVRIHIRRGKASAPASPSNLEWRADILVTSFPQDFEHGRAQTASLTCKCNWLVYYDGANQRHLVDGSVAV